MQVAQAQGHGELHRHPVGVPHGVVPTGVGRRQGWFDDVDLGLELGEVPVEGLPGLVDELGVPGAGRLAGGVALPADPAARVGQDLFELLVHARLGEVDGAAVGGGGTGEVLEHAPHLVVQPLLHGPAGRVARDGLRGLSGGGRGRGGRRRGRRGVPAARMAVVDRAAARGGGGGLGDGRGVRRGARVPGRLPLSAGRLSVARLPAVRGHRWYRPGLGRGAALVRAEGGGRRLPGAVAVRRARRGRLHRAGQPLGHRVVDAAGELPGLRQTLVGEEFGEAARVALADGAHLPGALPAVQLQGDDGRLGVQAGDGVAGDLGAVEAGDGDERGGQGAETDRARPAGGQGEQHADAVDGLRHGVQVHREAVVGGGLPGDFETRLGGRARVGHPLHAVDPAGLVAERGRGHDRRAGRDPDLETDLGERVILPPHQLGRHRLRPPVSLCGVVCRSPAPVVRVPPVLREAGGWTASGPGRYGRWPGCPGPSSSSPNPSGAPSP